MKKPMSVMLAMLAVAGCAKPSNIRTSEPAQKPATAVRTLDIVIVPSGPDASSEAFFKVKDNLGAALTSKLRARTGLTVHTRGAAESDADAILNIQIVHLNYVSAGARWMGGVMSGRATLETKVVLLDQRDARTLWNISTDAASSHAHGVLGGNTTTQVESLSEQLANELVRVLGP